MARYRNQYRDEVEENDELLARPKEEEKPEENQEEQPNPEEQTFKKRYGDLRRHSQAKEQELQSELQNLKNQLEEARKSTGKPPKTEEELNSWAEKYPDVYANIRTMILKEGQTIVSDIDKQKQELAQLRKRMAKDTAFAEVNAAHPDFFSVIRKDPEFHAWVEDQPKNVQDALYENETDARSAIRAIDFYKLEKGIITKKKEPKPEDIAKDTSLRNKPPAPDTGKKFKFKESEVAKMKPNEYEKNEDAIMTAIQNGEFEYDVTGAAR